MSALRSPTGTKSSRWQPFVTVHDLIPVSSPSISPLSLFAFLILLVSHHRRRRPSSPSPHQHRCFTVVIS
ncbi:hypothetical protein TIFTF001_021190 [Ficus carica]|uniref:Uncharacterized protein n=1 Tax=Ficus carica TaxID=3494 RepID=A0AA88AJZ4_FICCA|nr:hypothetical protein TIFTF001_021190 [Ficus carica]